MPLDQPTIEEACGARFQSAMRPIAGDNVDLPQVRANLLALGSAVHGILTGPAETLSERAHDEAFWTWVAQVQAYADALRGWHGAFAAAVAAWAPADPPGVALKAALDGLPPLPTPPAAAPRTLTGRIR